MTGEKYSKGLLIAVLLLRLAIGAVFVYSGFVKVMDPWGFLFKLEEYFAVWNFIFPRSVTLILALLLSVYEFVIGLLLMLGCYKRTAPVLLTLMMAVMLPLTLYLWIADPIADCGCFGDAFKLSNGMTFFKNVILTAALVFLIKNNKKVRFQIFRPAVQWLVVVLSLGYIIALGLICYNVQPMIDFRPYPVGSPILSENSDEEEDVIYVYSNGKQTKQFTIDNLPDENSGWEFVEAIEKSNNNDANKGFSIYDINGDNVAEDLILKQGKQFLLIIPEMNRADISFTYYINELTALCKKHNISFDAILATDLNGIDYWKDISMADYECFSAEDTSLKELVRGKIALVFLEDGIIKWKRTVSSLVESDPIVIEQEYGEEFTDNLFYEKWTLSKITYIYCLILCLIFFLQQIVVFLVWRRFRNSRKSKQSLIEKE